MITLDLSKAKTAGLIVDFEDFNFETDLTYREVAIKLLQEDKKTFELLHSQPIWLKLQDTLNNSFEHLYLHYQTKNIDDICEHISLNERKIDQLVWDFEDRIYARWANVHLGEELKVKVVDTEKAKAVCYEKMFGMKVNLENYKGQKLFSKMRVKIKSADIVTKVIVATIM